MNADGRFVGNELIAYEEHDEAMEKNYVKMALTDAITQFPSWKRPRTGRRVKLTGFNRLHLDAQRIDSEALAFLRRLGELGWLANCSLQFSSLHGAFLERQHAEALDAPLSVADCRFGVESQKTMSELMDIFANGRCHQISMWNISEIYVRG